MDIHRIFYAVGIAGLCASLMKTNEIGMALSFAAILIGSFQEYIVIDRSTKPKEKEDEEV